MLCIHHCIFKLPLINIFLIFFVLHAMRISSSEHVLLNSLHQLQICLTSTFLMCVFAFRGLELINSATHVIAYWPCDLGINTRTHAYICAHRCSRPHHPDCYCKCPDLEDPTESDSTKISLQGSCVNTSRCNINSISHGKSPCGMVVRGPASWICSDSALKIVRDRAGFFFYACE